MKLFLNIYRNILSFTVPIFIVTLIYLSSNMERIVWEISKDSGNLTVILVVLGYGCLDMILSLERYFNAIQDHPIMINLLVSHISTDYFTDCFVGKASAIFTVTFSLIGLVLDIQVFFLVGIILATLSIGLLFKFFYAVTISYKMVKTNELLVLQ